MNSLSKKSRSLSILKVVQHATQKTNVFYKSRAEPNRVRAMPSEEKAHGYEHKNFGEYSPDYTIYFL